MAVNEYERRIDLIIGKIQDKDIRSTMAVASKNRAYPKDCLTNGALEQLARKICEYEREILRLGGSVPLP